MSKEAKTPRIKIPHAVIPVHRMIDEFRTMVHENWAYVFAGKEKNAVDCSGAFIYCFEKHAPGRIHVDHSSNFFARRLIEGPLKAIDKAEPGEMAFKWREENKDTPTRWRDGKGDYYHVGLVGNDGLIYHASSPEAGCIASRPEEGWDYCGRIKVVNYSRVVDFAKEDDDMLYKARVATKTDDLRIRAEPVDGKVIGYAPKGCEVEVIKDGIWPRIRCVTEAGEVVGYVLGSLLKKIEQEDEISIPPFNEEDYIPPEPVDMRDMVSVPRDTLLKLADAVNRVKENPRDFDQLMVGYAQLQQAASELIVYLRGDD